jgi:hypothetical protein
VSSFATSPTRDLARNQLEIEPLRELLNRELMRWGIDELLATTGLSKKALVRLLNASSFTSVFVIDEVCVRLGFHPCEVYGTRWIEAGLRDAEQGLKRRRKRSRSAA